MATLEVHDGQGQVERLVITRDRTAMIGSSPKCDVVLKGEGILPFHGRIRWQPQKNLRSQPPRNQRSSPNNQPLS